MKTEKIHIGEKIQERIKIIGMNQSEFSRRINTTRQNARDIFSRESIDVRLLANICDILNYDFFAYYRPNEIVNTKTNKSRVLLQLELSNEDIELLDIKGRINNLLG